MSFTNAEIVCHDADPDEYRAVLAERGSPELVVSSSTLRLFAHNPRKWLRGYNYPETKAKRWGSLVDCLLLTPKEFGRRYAVQPETYEDCVMRCPQCGGEADSLTCRKCGGVKREAEMINRPWSARAEVCAEWAAGKERNGIDIITGREHSEAEAAIKQLLADDVIAQWHYESDKQVWVKADWRDPDTGLVIPCQCLLDYVPHEDSEFYKHVGDLKCVKNAASEPFTKEAFKYGWHIQGAFDLDMLAAAMPTREFIAWTFVISESYEPWETNRAIFGQGNADEMGGRPGLLDLGREDYKKMLGMYARCLQSGTWPGYNTIVDHVQGWAILRPMKYMVERGFTAVAEPERDQEPDEAPEDEEEITP